MIDNSEHVQFEVLSDFVDGDLDNIATRRVQEHLATCALCSAQHDSLKGMLAAVDVLPRSVLPPEDVWPDLRAKLNARKDVVLRTSLETGAPAVGSIRPLTISRRLAIGLAAAAVVLIVLSSGITALVLRGTADEVARVQSRNDDAPVRPQDAPSSMPVNFRQTETEFTRTIDELKQAVDVQRGQLSPETVRTVDHSLAVVDSAIAEARAALLADPNNAMLVDLLSASYQRKLDLLRRTSELGSRT